MIWGQFGWDLKVLLFNDEEEELFVLFLLIWFI